MLDPSLDLTPATESAYCPSCGLRHTRRPDWLCPRCSAPVETGAPPARTRSAAPAEAGFPVGSRVAGALMAAGGAALAAASVRHPPGAHRWPILAALAVLVVLGLASSLKLSWARWTAFGAGAVAALLGLEDLLRVRLPGLAPDPVPPALRAPVRGLLGLLYPATIFFALAFLAGILLLLAGRPGRARIAAGVLLASPLVVLEALRAFAG